MRTFFSSLLLILFLANVSLAHSVLYEDDTGHPLFRIRIPDGWAVSLDGDRVSIFPQTSGAFIEAWFLEGFEDEVEQGIYVKTLCETYFSEHELSAPEPVELDSGLHGFLLNGRAKRDESWGEVRVLIFSPCTDSVCFSLQFTPPSARDVPVLHRTVIERAHK